MGLTSFASLKMIVTPEMETFPLADRTTPSSLFAELFPRTEAAAAEEKAEDEAEDDAAEVEAAVAAEVLVTPPDPDPDPVKDFLRLPFLDDEVGDPRRYAWMDSMAAGESGVIC